MCGREILTEDGSVIHLVVAALWRCRGPGCCRAVRGAAVGALLLVRLLVDVEERRRPRAETVGSLQHSQGELLKTFTITNDLSNF